MMTPAQTPHRKRFYKAAAVAGDDTAGYGIELDNRTVKTPAGRKLKVSSRALAEAICEEWNAQGDTIVPASLSLTKLANSAIDGVMGNEARVAADILSYAATDLLCYRASHPEGLASLQAKLWDPILAWVGANYGAPFLISKGINHIAQPAASLEAIRRALLSFDAFKLAALHVMTSLTGSCLIALAHVAGHLDTAAAWTAAHADEDWQVSQWGQDFEAAERRKRRLQEFVNASKFFKLS